MTFYDIVQFAAALFGAVGSILCCLGAMSMGDSTITELATPRHGPSQAIIRSLHEQRAQYTLGAAFFALSFVLFAMSVAFQDCLRSKVGISPLLASLVGLPAAVLLLWVAWRFCQSWAKRKAPEPPQKA